MTGEDIDAGIKTAVQNAMMIHDMNILDIGGSDGDYEKEVGAEGEVRISDEGLTRTRRHCRRAKFGGQK
ncbi:hypothetical protein A5662_22650 [Mycobacteriaceae bacterium 1482268.1]|nr:hypothetical protein A5662_22650 [Mycobacteriaceae bacterium 1482268.1]